MENRTLHHTESTEVTKNLSQFAEELQMDILWMRKRLQANGIKRRYPERYTAAEVAAACADHQFPTLPFTDQWTGFITLKRVRYAEAHTWATYLKMKTAALRKQLDALGASPINGRHRQHVGKFYSEQDVLAAYRAGNVPLLEAYGESYQTIQYNLVGFAHDEKGTLYAPRDRWGKLPGINALWLRNRSMKGLKTEQRIPYVVGINEFGRLDHFFCEADVRVHAEMYPHDGQFVDRQTLDALERMKAIRPKVR